MADKIKLTAGVLILLAGIVGFYYYGDQPAYLRVLMVLAAALAGAAVAYQTEPGRRLWEFVKGARSEMRKVVWPSNKETVQVTLVVFAMVFAIALFLWIVDWGLLQAMQALTGRRA